MNNKFSMQLVWHNCKTHPPEEQFNPHLLVTDGVMIHDMVWDKTYDGYLKVGLCMKSDKADKYWWADIDQTVRGSFKLIK